METRRRWAVGIGLGLILSGCHAAAWLAHGVPQSLPAVYKLNDRRTLVLVDDPQRQLRDPALISVIVAQVAFDLTENKVVKDVVPVVEVNRVAAKQGADFEQQSAASLAQQLEAKQVVQVQIDGVNLEPSPGLVQPTAELHVKVIDASGKRLFPAQDAGGGAPAPRGYPLTVKMAQASPGVVPEAQGAALMRALATRIGREVAVLFYKHKVSAGDAAD